MNDEEPEVRAPTVRERMERWLGPPADYRLTRWLILRLLGVVYLFAFLGVVLQGPALFGEHGLTPTGTYLERLAGSGTSFWELPSVLWWDASDAALRGWAYAGLALSVSVVLGYANLPILVALWFVYGSFTRTGQLWFGFGWEIQLLETTLLAAMLAHPWDPRPLAAPSPPRTSIVLMRWLVFRVMLGAGLIKLRGDACWTELSCLGAHFETQPIPNPLSPWFHHLPGWLHAAGVVFTHVAELVLPWCVFGPRRLRLVAGIGMTCFQLTLIASGNLAFFNWITLVCVLACFDDAFLLRLVPARARGWLVARLRATQRGPGAARDGKQLAIAFGVGLIVILSWTPMVGALSAPGQVALACVTALVLAGLAWWHQARITSPGARLDGWQLAVGAFAALVAIKSVPVVENLLSSRQAMNRSFDRLALVNTYGAFGTVGDTRYELVIEGTRDADPTDATWQPYELPCKPGDLARRPCVLGPYHRRLDWLIWFAAMAERPRDPWVLHLVHKLLDGDRTVRALLATDPFAGEPPTWIRIRRFVYRLAPPGADTWWTREREQLWLRPVALGDPELRRALARFGGPSPSVR